ncbi:MAG: malonate decarboxylase holo-[acyl-carrier-protein] synthase [Rhodocyclales bacterium]|nr:malonate decarboxylase holo-[acyl-carrier-protein] synthase [Rhodocyclales bacterium]
MPERVPARHDLAWLDRDAAGAARLAAPACIAEREAQALLADWLRRGHPLIVTSQPAGVEAPTELRLGLALPPAQGKRRLAFFIPRRSVQALTPPPALADAAPALPLRWQPALLALQSMAAVAACAPRVYGSAAIQVSTGEACLGDDSDLDLLLAPTDWNAALAACAALAEFASGCGLRVDGEIRNARGHATAWRELAGRPGRLLVKGDAGATLLALADFAAGFAAAPLRQERQAA